MLYQSTMTVNSGILKIENMTSNNGTKVANQFIIKTENCVFFQSYSSIIVKIENGVNGKTYLDADTWDYSKTTGKYRNQFLGEDKKETERKIKEGIYILTNLN